MTPAREAWLAGPVPGVVPVLQPVAHVLVQVRTDLPPLLESLAAERLWAAPGESAPIGFHAAHLAGALERLFTYAKGGPLTEAQRAALEIERTVSTARPPGGQLARRVNEALETALRDLTEFREDALLAPREVGRARLPSTVLGLLFHAAEHTSRHAGQIQTLLRVVGWP